MKLTDSERAMLDGHEGKAKQKAMELLVRYAQALGADRFVDTHNVAGVPGSYSPLLLSYYKASPKNAYDIVYSRFDLDSDEVVEVPRVTVSSCHLQGGVDPENWQTLGAKPESLHRAAQPPRPHPSQTLWSGGRLLGGRRDVSPRRHHAGSGHARDGRRASEPWPTARK